VLWQSDLPHAEHRSAGRSQDAFHPRLLSGDILRSGKAEFAPMVESFKAKLAAKLKNVRDNDLKRKEPG